MTIEKNRYCLPLNCLFQNAARDNAKRKFLFVSKVLGKHIPMHPMVLRIIGGILARTWLYDIENIYTSDIEELISSLLSLTEETNPQKDTMLTTKEIADIASLLDTPLKLKEKTLFIGFAETATGIAQAVFSCFSNAGYIHTTREELEGLSPAFIFKEEHSHAVEHMLFPKNSSFLHEYDRIVLIDDELTTGKTAINLINKLPGANFGIITVLDWRNPLQFEQLNLLRNKSLIVSSLVKGTLNEVTELPSHSIDNIVEFKNSNNTLYDELYISDALKIENAISLNGRFGITSTEQLQINSHISQVAKLLLKRRVSGNLLCLGTEEFIYIPGAISAQLGQRVYFHSTTRSPIFSNAGDNYCIKNKLCFHSPYDHNRKNFVYNLPNNFYKQAFVFLEKPIDENSKQMFLGIFKKFQIANILFVICN